MGFARQTRATGFSLIEVLCAILILGVGIAGLTVGITTALGSSKESERQTTAALIAAGRIELLRADGFLIEGVEEGEFTGGLSMYRWRQTVSATGIDGLYDVSIAVENSETGQGIYELRTLLFDPPIETETDREERNRRDSRDPRRGGSGV